MGFAVTTEASPYLTTFPSLTTWCLSATSYPAMGMTACVVIGLVASVALWPLGVSGISTKALTAALSRPPTEFVPGKDTVVVPVAVEGA